MVEDIPAGHQVSRHIDSPHKWKPEERTLIDANVFEFPGGQVESVVWRKYAVGIAAVHELGCQRQRVKREGGKATWTYEGAITAEVDRIRAIKTSEGHGFHVEHAPEEGNWHAHISLMPAPGQQLNKGHKINLKEWLRGVFSPVEVHTCA